MICAPAQAGRPASRSLLAPFFAQHYADGTVTLVQKLSPAWLQIRISSSALYRLHYLPGQHVRIELRDPLSLYGILRPVETMRTYTLWNFSPLEQCFELRVHLYDGDGIGLDWARRARVGDAVRFWGPQGDFIVRAEAPWHLFVGEETASAAFGPMIRALDGNATVHAVLESDTPDDALALPAFPGLRRIWRRGASPVASQRLVNAVAALDLPAGPGAAYIAGEARTCQMVRDHLVRERGWPRSAIRVKPFWAPGKRGLH